MRGAGAREACVGLAVVMIGGLVDGCGGQLAGSPGGSGRGGSSADAGTGGNVFGEPACLSTVVRSTACGPADQQLCYKTCGPEKTGRKSETCVDGVHSEMSGCIFDPSQDYSCYAIPAAQNAACPQAFTPQASTTCQVDHCVLCNSLAGLTGGGFLDSTGAFKTGYCTCQLPDAAGERTWTCASDTSWPCPLGVGCRPGGGTGTDGGADGGMCLPSVNCMPPTGRYCGTIGNGCPGGTLECPGCSGADVCRAGLCVGGPSCVPISCDIARGGRYCSTIGDGCGGTLDCGGCPNGGICGGSIRGVCGTLPDSAPPPPPVPPPPPPPSPPDL